MDSTVHILLVEDDFVEAKTVQRALRDLRVNNPLHITSNGEEALAYLRDSSNPRPGIILLDLNMPKMGGLEMLAILKDDAELRRIPVIVLTTSRQDEDRVASFNLSVAGYMIKPVGYQQFVEAIRTINLYWTLSEVV